MATSNAKSADPFANMTAREFCDAVIKDVIQRNRDDAFKRGMKAILDLLPRDQVEALLQKTAPKIEGG